MMLWQQNTTSLTSISWGTGMHAIEMMKVDELQIKISVATAWCLTHLCCMSNVRSLRKLGQQRIFD